MRGPTCAAARRSIARLSAPAIVLIAAVAARALFTIDRPPARFWDTYSYVAVSLQLRDGHFPDIGVRPIGYPLFLAVTSEDGTGDRRSIRVQMVLGALSSLLVLFSLDVFVRRKWLSLALALATTTFVDLLYAEATLYSESLCAFLVMCAVSALALSEATSERRWLGLATATAALSLATIVRPVFVVPLVMLTVSLPVLRLRRCVSRREAAAPLVMAAVMLGPYVMWNAMKFGTPNVAVGPGTSLLNYVGFPEVYDDLPDRFSALRSMYRTLGDSRPDRFVGWWDAMPAADPAGYPALSDVERDRVALRLAVPLLASTPAGYLKVWLQTAWHFLADVDVGPGFYVDPEHMADGDSDLSPAIRIIATRVQAFWGSINWAFSIVGALLLPVLVILVGGARTRSLSFTLLWLMLVATVVVSTLIEPCPGQARYRWPLQLPFVVMTGWALAASLDLLPLRSRTPNGEWYGLR